MTQPTLSTIIRAFAAALIGYALYSWSAYYTFWYFTVHPDVVDTHIIPQNSWLLITCVHQTLWGFLLFGLARPLSRLITDARSR
jgi:hypothetical protein